MNRPFSNIANRRRVLTLIAGAALTAGGVPASAASRRAFGRRAFEWRGTALGADARLVLVHDDHAAAQRALRLCLDEIERLENLFSLYRPDSELSRLNRDGVLRYPSLDMVSLLRVAHTVSQASGGAFDVSVQPLWQLYANHFRQYPGDRAGPPAREIKHTLQHIDFARVRISEMEIRIRPGMALTLNGIAQGYITDRVAELLRARGWPDVLINLGEVRATGVSPVGSPWAVLLDLPVRSPANPSPLTLLGRAIATSAGRATVFEASGHHHHLFSPHDGRSAGEFYSVSVVASHATLADALSTALYVTPRDEMPRLIKAFPAVEAWLVDANGSIEHLT
jgi:thiamine biosynthesis lipoprotein